MKTSRQELLINVVIDRLISNIRSFPVLPSFTKQVLDYLKQASFLLCILSDSKINP